MNAPLDTPVLFLVFNRPETTRRVHAAIAAARPRRLYVAADGPRADRPDEAGLCDEVRALATAVDWPCEVHTLFRKENLGCGEAIGSALDWFFEAEEEGIILEDDCLPGTDFFPYCAALLDHHRDEARVMSIAGVNFQPPARRSSDSYYFSQYPHCWGWATWRRAWAHYDRSLSAWPPFRDGGRLLAFFDGDPVAVRYWTRILDKTSMGAIDTWDYQWAFALWEQGGLACTPSVNLVTNVGFGVEATHTRKADETMTARPLATLPEPLQHPTTLERDVEADHYTEQHVFKVAATRRKKSKILGSKALRSIAEELKGLRRRLRRR